MVQDNRDGTATISHSVSSFLLNASSMEGLVNFIFHINKILHFDNTRACRVIFHAFQSTAVFFFFSKSYPSRLLQWITFWIQLRPDVLSGLIWVQTVCIHVGYQLTTVTVWYAILEFFIITWECPNYKNEWYFRRRCIHYLALVEVAAWLSVFLLQGEQSSVRRS